MLDREVERIVDAAVRGVRPSRDDIAYLLQFDVGSAEAAYVCQKAGEVGMRACGGRGYVYAQIGVDETACPENCLFCSFAAINVDAQAYRADFVEVPLERIVHYARLFNAAHVDLVSLMATAGLSFDRYLEIVRAVRECLSADVDLMVNTADLSLEQARALKEAGATVAYHALRLGEGDITDIEPADRRRTMRNIRSVGLSLMTGVEPVWDGVDPLELSERIFELPDFDPSCIGACSLTAVEGLDVDGRRPAATEFVRYVGALARLECGQSVPVGGIGGVVWVDAGCDPRNRGYGFDDETLRQKVDSARRRLESKGFTTAC